MKILLVFFISFLVFKSSAQEKVGFAFDGNERILSARALGLGGAYTALVDDATGIHFNPGALGFLQGPSIVISGGFIKNFGNLESTEVYSGNFYTTQTATFSESPIKPVFNQVSAAVPLMLGNDVVVTPAFGYSINSANIFRQEQWDYEIEEYDDFGNSIVGTNTYTFETKGGRRDLSYGFGIAVNEYLSFGFTQHVYSGDRKSTETFQYTQDGTSDPTQTEITTVKFSGKRTSFGFKYSSSGSHDQESDEYDEGVDAAFAVDLPSTLISRVVVNGQSGDFYFRNAPIFKLGFAGRTETTIFVLNGIYQPAQRNTSTLDLAGNLSRIDADSLDVLSLGLGVESLKNLRGGLRLKQYQFKNEDGNQPWTIQLNGGFSFFDLNHHFTFDIGASAEFYNWGTVITVPNYGYVDYKGVLLNILASIRFQIPY